VVDSVSVRSALGVQHYNAYWCTVYLYYSPGCVSLIKHDGAGSHGNLLSYFYDEDISAIRIRVGSKSTARPIYNETVFLKSRYTVPKVTLLPTSVGRVHYKMMSGVCLSVCLSVRLSVCCVSRSNARRERHRKPKISSTEAHQLVNLFRGQKVKGEGHWVTKYWLMSKDKDAIPTCNDDEFVPRVVAVLYKYLAVVRTFHIMTCRCDFDR